LKINASVTFCSGNSGSKSTCYENFEKNYSEYIQNPESLVRNFESRISNYEVQEEKPLAPKLCGT